MKHKTNSEPDDQWTPCRSVTLASRFTTEAERAAKRRKHKAAKARAFRKDLKAILFWTPIILIAIIYWIARMNTNA